MPKSRAVRLAYVLIVCACLFVIGRNLYRRSLNEELYEAVTKSDLPTVRACIARHADLDYKHPLTDAIANADGSPKTQSVMEAARDRARAVQKNADDILCLLAEHDTSGPPILNLNDACGTGSLRIMRFVLEHGPPENATTLNAAVDHILNTMYPAKDAAARRAFQRQMIQMLREHGAQITAAQAIQLDDPAALHTLLAAPTARLTSADAAAALCEATRRSDWQTSQLLLAHGADVNAANRYGETPLIIAAQNGDRKMALALLAAHAKRDIRTKWSGTAWERAESAYHYEMAQLLCPGDKAIREALAMAAANGDVALARAALAKGADVNAGDKYGNTALFCAARDFADTQALSSMTAEAIAKIDHVSAFALSGGPRTVTVPDMRARKLELMRLLLEHGARPDAPYATGDTPLMLAAQTAPDAVKLLLSHGADPNRRNDHGSTPLMFAARYGNVEAARMLLEKGAEVNIRNDLGDTPLLLAAKFNLAAIPLLLEHHADVSVKAVSGYTVLAYARKLRKPEIVKLLEAAGAKDE